MTGTIISAINTQHVVIKKVAISVLQLCKWQCVGLEKNTSYLFSHSISGKQTYMSVTLYQ